MHSIISYHRLQWIPLHQSLAPWRILWFGRHKFSLHCKHLFAVYVCISQHYTKECQKSVPKSARSSPKVGTPNPAYTILSQSFILSGFTLFCNASQPAFVELSTKVSLLSFLTQIFANTRQVLPRCCHRMVSVDCTSLCGLGDKG